MHLIQKNHMGASRILQQSAVSLHPIHLVPHMVTQVHTVIRHWRHAASTGCKHSPHTSRRRPVRYQPIGVQGSGHFQTTRTQQAAGSATSPSGLRQFNCAISNAQGKMSKRLSVGGFMVKSINPNITGIALQAHESLAATA